MATHVSPGFDLAAIKERLPLAELCANEGVILKRAGSWLVGLCPFHEEKSPSFQIGSQRPDRFVCRGCAEHGDIFDFWAKMHGLDVKLDFKRVVEELASLAGLTSAIEGVRWSPKARVVAEVTDKLPKPIIKPPLPRLRMLKEAEIEQLAKLRGLSVAGVRAAAHEFKRVGACVWPQHEGFHGWTARGAITGEGLHVVDSAGSYPCWVATDAERRTAAFRRMDGRTFPTHTKNENDEWVMAPPKDWIKSWSTAGKSWPLGAADMGDRNCVLMIEGEPDMLAGYHFLCGFRLLDRVAVVCMLGASSRIAEDALPFFRGKRVRIIEDADDEKAVKDKAGKIKKMIRPGREAAARWTTQLTKAGAAVKTFQLHGLVRANGEPVKDLCHVAECNAETVASDDVTDAFFEWDF